MHVQRRSYVLSGTERTSAIGQRVHERDFEERSADQPIPAAGALNWGSFIAAQGSETQPLALRID
jgi:hypothetical protein